jgi:hypothetical protein
LKRPPGHRAKNERPCFATWSFDRSDQKKPEFTCCCCLSPRVWDQTSSKASLYDVERSGRRTIRNFHWKFRGFKAAKLAL